VIPDKYSDIQPMHFSPQLQWTDVPMGTVSFMLVFHDPDVVFNKSAESSTLHWLVWNIPGESRGLPENMPPTAKMPDGTIQGKNQGNVVGYRGPGANAAGPRHHYTFELYALDTKLDLTPEATRAEVIKASNGHVLGKAILVGRFMRPN
jgi:Raf kinase inhibitor-like YbhB/YbcL family protein